MVNRDDQPRTEQIVPDRLNLQFKHKIMSGKKCLNVTNNLKVCSHMTLQNVRKIKGVDDKNGLKHVMCQQGLSYEISFEFCYLKSIKCHALVYQSEKIFVQLDE